MSIEQERRETLHAAQQNARRVLDEARVEVEQLLASAHQEALRVIMEQQRIAEELLLAEETEAEQVAAKAGADAASESEAMDTATTAEKLLNSQREIADALREAQKRAPQILNGAVESAATGVLMRSHREAAAILLEARMRIDADRALTRQ